MSTPTRFATAITPVSAMGTVVMTMPKCAKLRQMLLKLSVERRVKADVAWEQQQLPTCQVVTAMPNATATTIAVATKSNFVGLEVSTGDRHSSTFCHSTNSVWNSC
mmetsp:Transcript_16815/g.32807  ORF Transcript_16815/g.32807 Transcript_16815/m.32807 type:complete len:106 (-) Transcript_16815:134-451(-)